MKQQLTRSSDKLIAGVCSGVARSFGIDATLVRIVWAVASCFFGLPVVLYVVLWLVLPIDGGGTGIDDLKKAFSSTGNHSTPPSDDYR
jgi:phage shock protein C